MPAFLLALIPGFIPARLAKPILIAGGIILAALALWGLVELHDRRVVQKHDAAISAAVAVASSNADAAANAGDATTAAANAIASSSNARTISDAATAHPEEVRRAAGPASVAIARELRRRQTEAGAATGRTR